MPIPKHGTYEVKPQPTTAEDLIIGGSAIVAALVAIGLIFLKR